MNKIFIVLVMLSILFFMNCAIPQKYWPQQDVGVEQVGNQTARNKILLFSSQSDFKDGLINEIKSSIEEGDYFLKITGLESLKTENTEDYDKVIIIATCLSWGLEYSVQEFLDNYDNMDKVILITTSGDGNWKPNKYERKIDAIATASKKVRIPKIVYEVRQIIEETK